MNIIAGSRCFQQKHNAKENGFPSFVFSGPGRKTAETCGVQVQYSHRRRRRHRR